jgi:hypothetical protein
MWRQPSSAVSGAKRRPASMERTLLSVAFDVDVDFDFDRTPIRRGCPIFRVFCERWEPRTPAAPFLTLTLLLLLQVWNGHSCPLPLTLILTLLGKGGWPTLAHHNRGCPIRRGFRRMGTTNASTFGRLLSFLANQHSPPTSASSERRFSTLFLRPAVFVPIFRHFSNPIHLSHSPPTNYSFKVVFRVFRDFHSVRVKPL